MPDVKEMVAEYLKEKGYDGLYSEDGECGCELADLAPCLAMGTHCRAGYRVDGCACGEGHDFHIQEGKPNGG